MIQVKNLSKTYYPKKGAPVTALRNVSVSFAESGMVFILGKSGSGKSTFLNLLGGLDKMDFGEIVIKGKSSNDFTQSDFDSYRNTFIGFIFQEYNILNEFSVGKNISLALELQGKRHDEKAVSEIMDAVDLGGYQKRRPNELSGGQKQRVAIARALIKNPDIIMADEPTGALDSNTGRQVFETLKKLSKEKLVIIVSHDREYAEFYGDRVIEFADGVIISDIEKTLSPPVGEGAVTITDGKILQIKKGKKLTAEDKRTLDTFLAKAEEDGAVISLDEKSNAEFKKAARIDDEGNKENFSDTKDVKTKDYDPKDFKLIRSRLPYLDSLKMGASGLKVKPIRLAITILLSAIAFCLFGLADTMASYKNSSALMKSLRAAGVTDAVLQKQVNYLQRDGDVPYGSEFFTDTMAKRMTEAELNMLRAKFPAENFVGVFGGLHDIYLANRFSEKKGYESGYYQDFLSNFCELDEARLNFLGYRLLGANSRLPTADDEIAVSEFVYTHFKDRGYSETIWLTDEINGFPYPWERKINIRNYDDLIGKELDYGGETKKIVGIVDTKFNFARYAQLREDSQNNVILGAILGAEFSSVLIPHTTVFVRSGFYEEVFKPEIANSLKSDASFELDFGSVSFTKFLVNANAIYNQSTHVKFVYWQEGRTDFNLKDDEIILSADAVIRVLETLTGLYFNNVQNDVYNQYGKMDFISAYFAAKGVDVSEATYEDWDEINKLWSVEALKIMEKRLAGGILGREITVNYYNEQEGSSTFVPLKIVGVIDYPNFNGSNYVLFTQNTEAALNVSSEGDYTYVWGKFNKKTMSSLLSFAGVFNGDVRYVLLNEISFAVGIAGDIVEELAKVFLYIGLGFCFFASFLLINFISTSISYKKREIGVLRAVGARSSDVFGIFFNESLIIALINAFIAIIGCLIATSAINNMLRDDVGLLVKLLMFGARQVFLVLGVSIAVAFIASFLPVLRIAKKRPIDAINNK